MIFKGYLFGFLYGALCLALGWGLHKLGVSKKVTRKVVHILVGFEWIILYHFVGATYHFLLVCIAFLLLLLFVYKKNLMPMIQSEGDNAPGTVYYAVAMSIMATVTLFVPKMILPFGIGVFCTSWGDGMAGLVGQGLKGKLNPKIFGEKSLAGAVSNFIVCLGVAILFSSIFSMDIGLLQCILIAIFALELELFSVKGLDNIAITLGVSLLSYSFCNFDFIWNYIIPIILTPLLIAFVIQKKVLSISGTVAAILLDLVVSITLGNRGFLILFSFLLGGVITDKIKKKAEKMKQSEKRGAMQVLCNGGVCALFSLAYFITGELAFLVGFCSSLSEALADTAASGIGVFSKNTYDVFRLKKCDKGLSGGVSLIGTSAALCGAAVISLICLALGMLRFESAVLVTLCGFLGCFFDTFLGSIFQRKYECTVCGKITEKKIHCGDVTRHFRGIKFIDNNVVNFLGTLFSGAVAAFVTYAVIS